MERPALVVVKATVVGILCLIILAGAWHAPVGAHFTAAAFFRWSVLLVMLLVVYFSERQEYRDTGSWEVFVPAGIVVLAILALGVIQISAR